MSGKDGGQDRSLNDHLALSAGLQFLFGFVQVKIFLQFHFQTVAQLLLDTCNFGKLSAKSHLLFIAVDLNVAQLFQALSELEDRVVFHFDLVLELLTQLFVEFRYKL
jgi:hypothetical protein